MVAKQGIKGVLGMGWRTCLGLLFFVTVVGSARAQRIPAGAARFYLVGDTLKVDVKIDSLFSPRALDAIESGMTTSVSLQLRLAQGRRSRLLLRGGYLT